MEIVATSGGINWTWYHWLTVDGNVATETHSARFHNWKIEQGAEQHPVATHRIDSINCFPSPSMLETWPEMEAEFNARVKRLGLPADTQRYCWLVDSDGKSQLVQIKAG